MLVWYTDRSLVTSRQRAAAFWMMLGGQLCPVNREICTIISTSTSAPSQPGATAT